MNANTPPSDRPRRGPDVAIVHDHLVQRGGAERVVALLAELLGDAAIHTSFFAPAHTHAALGQRTVRAGLLNKIGPLRSRHRWAFPLLAPAFHRTKPAADVTVLSTIGWAHFARPSGRTVAYWYAPARWLYQRDVYIRGARAGGGWRGGAVSVLAPLLERWDRRAVERIDHHVAISTSVATRLNEIYGIDADVVHPPVQLTESADIEAVHVLGLPDRFVVAVSRFMSYKNIDRLVEAMVLLPDERLVVVGDGPENDRLRALAGSNVHFTGTISDAELVDCYRRCAGLVTVANEDFGLTPLEAASFGKPTLALRAGGFLDTISDGATGRFVDSLDTIDVAAGIAELLDHDWDESAIRAHAETFSIERFAKSIRTVVERVGAGMGESDQTTFATPTAPHPSSTLTGSGHE